MSTGPTPVVDGSSNLIVATISGNGTSGPSVSTPWPPTGVNTGDIAIALAADFNVSSTVGTPSTSGTNWTQLDTKYTADTLFAHVVAASEAAPVLHASTYEAVIIFFIRFINATAPSLSSLLNAAINWDATGPLSNYAFNGLSTPSQNNCLPILVACCPGAATGLTAPSQYNATTNANVVLGSGSKPITLAVFTAAQQGTAASIASGSITASGSSGVYPRTGVFAINPGTPSGGTVAISGMPVTTIHPGDTNVIINGTFPGTSDTVTLIDRSNTLSCSVTTDGASQLKFTVPAFASNGLNGVCFGSCTLKVANGGNNASIAVTLAPSTGSFSATPIYQTLQTLRQLQFTQNQQGSSTPSRLYSNPDITNGSQILIGPTAAAIGSAGGLGSNAVSVDIDGTFYVDQSTQEVSWYSNPNTGSGDAWTTSANVWDVGPPFPQLTGTTISTQNWTQSSAISPTIAAANCFSELDTANGNALTYSISGSGGALPTGVSISGSTGVISGTPSGTGTVNNIIPRATDSWSHYTEVAGFSETTAASASNNAGFSGSIAGLAQQTVGVAIPQIAAGSNFTNIKATGGYSLSSVAGLLDPTSWLSVDNSGNVNGTPTSTGLSQGQIGNFGFTITGTASNATTATSDIITIPVLYPQPTTTVPTFSSPDTTADLTSLATAANLVAAFPISWSGSQPFTQSILGGQVVAQGTTIAFILENQSVSDVKSEQIIVIEQAPLSQAPPTEFRAIDTCAVAATDGPGSVYRFFRVTSSAKIEDLRLMNDALPQGSLYNCGVLLTTAAGGTPPVTGADSIFFQSIPMDNGRSTWEFAYFPSMAGRSPSISNVGKRIWELLGYQTDPGLALDVAVTAAASGDTAGSIALRMEYVSYGPPPLGGPGAPAAGGYGTF